MAVSEFSDVFVSYRRKDVEFVKPLVERLQADGKEVWIDWEDIPPGSVGFTDDIKNGLDGADAFIAVLSPDYLESTYCVDMELKYAISLNKKIIPIVYRKFEGDVPAGIGHINWIYFTPHAGQANTFDESYPRVIEALEADLEHVRAHKRFLLRALEWEKNDKANSFLLRGDELENMEKWLALAASKSPDPTELHVEYFHKSEDAERKRQRMVFIGISTAMVISIVLAILSLIGFYTASQAEDRAVEAQKVAERRAIEAEARFLASNLPNIGQSNPFLAYGLALDLFDMEDIPIAVRAASEDYLASAAAIREYRGHSENFVRANVSPDDEYILSGAADNILILWSLETGEEIRRFDQGDDVLGIMFLSDAKHALVADTHGIVKLWDVETGEEIRTYIVSEDSAVFDIALSPDDKTFAAATGDQFVRMIDIETGDVLWATDNHDDAVRSIDISPDGKLVGSSSDDMKASLFDAETGEILFTLEGHENEVRAVTFSPDSTVFVTGGRDSLIKQWDTATGELLKTWTYNANGIFTLAYAPDGGSIYSGDEIGVVSQWDIEQGSVIANYSGHTSRVQSLVFTPDGSHTITASDDGAVILWTFSRTEDLLTIPAHESEEEIGIMGVELLGDGVRAVSAAEDKTARLWDITTGEELMVYEGHTEAINRMTIAHDGSFFVTVSSDSTARIWDIDEPEARFVLEGHRGALNAVAVSNDDTRVATSSCAERNEVGRCTVTEYFFWDTATGEQVHGFTADTGWNYSLMFSPDDQSLYVGSEYNYAARFDIETSEELQRYEGHSAQVLEVVLHPNGENLLTTSADRTMTLYDIETGEGLLTYVGHTDWVEDAAFFENGLLIVSSSDDGTAALWDSRTGEVLRRYQGHTHWVETIDLSADNETFITGAWDQTIRIWRVFADNRVLESEFLSTYDVDEITCEYRELYRTPVQCETPTE